MISFKNDYSRGAHPRVLEKLLSANTQSFTGYGEDEVCAAAQRRMRALIQDEQAALHLVAGGTQANLLVIASILKPHQGVIAAQSAHIHVHETGAIEATGHKVLALPSPDGKLRPEQVENLVQAHWQDANHEHAVQPGMVYISQTTELGTVYSLKELQALHRACRALGLPLYIDGARLGHAIHSEGADFALHDIARCCEAFTIGLTKQGALFGEAIVIREPSLQKDFRYLIKQRGAMLAKGWLLGLQFEALFEDGLYLRLSQQANAQAMRIRDAIDRLRIPSLTPSPSNQQFPILPNPVIAGLRERYSFELIEAVDEGHTAIRFVTSWSTEDSEVEQLIADLERLYKPAM